MLFSVQLRLTYRGAVEEIFLRFTDAALEPGGMGGGLGPAWRGGVGGRGFMTVFNVGRAPAEYVCNVGNLGSTIENGNQIKAS